MISADLLDDLPAPGAGALPPSNPAEAIALARRHFLEAMVLLSCLVASTDRAPENMNALAQTLLKSVCDGVDALEHHEALNLSCAGSA